MRIITDKGEELPFPLMRIFGVWAFAWVAGVFCGWGWFATRHQATIEPFIFGWLLGALCLCGLFAYTAKK